MNYKLTYRQLLTMLENANWAADFYWKNEVWVQHKKYAKIGKRIIQAMEKYNTNQLITN
jgi:hypothetical protein